MTPSQLAMVADKARACYDKEAKERQKRKPESVVETLPQQNHTRARDAAGKALGVSGRSVDFARTVREKHSRELLTQNEKR